MCHPTLAQMGSIRAEAMEWLAQFANNHVYKKKTYIKTSGNVSELNLPCSFVGNYKI